MSFLGEHFEDRVRPERPVALPDDLEHPLPHRSERRSALAADRLGVVERVRHAVTVIVLVGREPTTQNVHASHEIESRERPSPVRGTHRQRGYKTASRSARPVPAAETGAPRARLAHTGGQPAVMCPQARKTASRLAP